jgi:hypothetical protein
MLARIEHGPAVSDLLTFECPKCEHVQKVLTEDQSNRKGWLAEQRTQTAEVGPPHLGEFFSAFGFHAQHLPSGQEGGADTTAPLT